MIGIILCSHSNFASGLKDACEMIAGTQEQFEAITFDGTEDLLSLGDRLKECAKNYQDGCIYVCDLMNGTPFNGCLLAIAETENVILTGASVPMVLELVIQRNNTTSSPEQLALKIVQSSQEYVTMRHSRDIFGNS